MSVYKPRNHPETIPKLPDKSLFHLGPGSVHPKLGEKLKAPFEQIQTHGSNPKAPGKKCKPSFPSGNAYIKKPLAQRSTEGKIMELFNTSTFPTHIRPISLNDSQSNAAKFAAFHVKHFVCSFLSKLCTSWNSSHFPWTFPQSAWELSRPKKCESHWHHHPC